MLLNKTNITDIRREYKSGQLHRSNLTVQPIQLFSIWLNQACSAQISDPTAMCLATVDNTGQPHQRIVLLKHFTDKFMIFYTNLNSRKAIHLNNNSKVSLCFPWHAIDKQVIVTGNIYKVSQKDAQKQFYTRPKDNQISTYVSKQSKIISSRKVLESKFLKFKQKYFHTKIPFPKFWGGYKININSIEFWQGRKHRLHDRFIYKQHKNTWNIYRLSP